LPTKGGKFQLSQGGLFSIIIPSNKLAITLTIDNRASIALKDLPPRVSAQLQERLSFPNPVWLENEKRGYSNWQVPETLRFYGLAGGRLALPGLGIFSVSERPERTGRNPQTGEPLTIAASKAVKFKPGKALKEAVR